MILKDISSTPVFYDGEHIGVSLAEGIEGIEEETGPPTTGSDRESHSESKLAHHPLGSH